MSGPTRRASTALVTIWRRLSEDELGRETYGVPYTIYGCYDNELSSKYTKNGIENAPNSVLWMESSSLDPKKGDFLVKGDKTAFANPCDAGAEVITLVKISDCSFLRQPDDIMIMT